MGYPAKWFESTHRCFIIMNYPEYFAGISDYYEELQEEETMAKLNKKKTSKDSILNLQDETKGQYRVQDVNGKLVISEKLPKKFTIRDLR